MSATETMQSYQDNLFRVQKNGFNVSTVEVAVRKSIIFLIIYILKPLSNTFHFHAAIEKKGPA